MKTFRRLRSQDSDTPIQWSTPSVAGPERLGVARGWVASAKAWQTLGTYSSVGIDLAAISCKRSTEADSMSPCKRKG